jgi:hypothetical protein
MVGRFLLLLLSVLLVSSGNAFTTGTFVAVIE